MPLPLPYDVQPLRPDSKPGLFKAFVGSSTAVRMTAKDVSGLFVMGATDGKRLISQMPDVSAVFVEQGDSGLVISTAGKLTGLTRLSH